MKVYALMFFILTVLSLVGITLASLSAIEEISSTEAFERILEVTGDFDEPASQVARIAVEQIVFGERLYLRWLFQVGTIGLLALLGFMVLAWIGHRKLVEPLRWYARALAEGRFEIRPGREFRELRLLVEAFDAAQRELRRRGKEEMARYTVHQMKNLWTPVRLAADLLRSADASVSSWEVSGLLDAQIAKMDRLLRLFQGLYAFPEPRPQAISWSQELPRWLGGTGIPFVIRVQDGAERAVVDSALMEQALDNLVRNAWEAQGQSGPPVEVVVDGRGIAVLDRGCGFSGEGKPRGLGLGLEFCRRVAEAHGMVLTYADRDAGGSIVCLEWRERKGS